VVLQNVSLPDEAVEALASTLPEHLASWSSSTRSACCGAPRCWRRWRRTRASTRTSGAGCAS
jgi:hypothetical protein